MSLQQLLKHCRVEYVGEVTSDHCRAFLFNGRVNRGWTPETFLFYFKALLPFFKWCIKNGHLDANPLEGIDLPRREKKLPKRISKDEAMKLLEYSY